MTSATVAPLSTHSLPSSANEKWRAVFRMTRPRTPRSPIRMLAPSPRTKKGTPSSRAAMIAFASSSADVASKKRSAGPPILKVVYGPRGTSRLARPFGRRAASASSAAIALASSVAVASALAPAVTRAQAHSVTSVAASATAQRATLEKVIKREVLPNGMEIIVAENHGVPLATIEIDVRNGAFTQAPGFEGLAHMYEHMFFKANADLPEPEAFVDRAGELGAVFNGTTTEERVNYYVTLPSDSLRGGVQF